jgi:hypothetical protein
VWRERAIEAMLRELGARRSGEGGEAKAEKTLQTRRPDERTREGLYNTRKGGIRAAEREIRCRLLWLLCVVFGGLRRRDEERELG